MATKRHDHPPDVPAPRFHLTIHRRLQSPRLVSAHQLHGLNALLLPPLVRSEHYFSLSSAASMRANVAGDCCLWAARRVPVQITIAIWAAVLHHLSSSLAGRASGGVASPDLPTALAFCKSSPAASRPVARLSLYFQVSLAISLVPHAWAGGLCELTNRVSVPSGSSISVTINGFTSRPLSFATQTGPPPVS